MTTQTTGAPAPDTAPVPRMPAVSAPQPVVPRDEPRSYVHQARGPGYRWWRPILGLFVATFAALVLAAVILGGFALTGLIDEATMADVLHPWASLSNNLVLAALIPATFLGMWAGFGIRPGRVLSVAGRMRWGWLARCVVVVTPLWLAFLVVSWFVFDMQVSERPERWLALLVVSLLTTPLQAAGEELAFRGGLLQGIGAWFRSPVVALGVTTVLSTALFALAHMSLDPWVLVSIGSTAVAGCWLTWRTGGLEAIIVLHVVNNLLVFGQGNLLGGLADSYVDETTTAPMSVAVANVVATAIVTAVMLRLARREGNAPQGWTEPALG